VGWLAGHTWKSNGRWYTERPVLFCAHAGRIIQPGGPRVGYTWFKDTSTIMGRTFQCFPIAGRAHCFVLSFPGFARLSFWWK
jgi:hypothetical protein